MNIPEKYEDVVSERDHLKSMLSSLERHTGVYITRGQEMMLSDLPMLKKVIDGVAPEVPEEFTLPDLRGKFFRAIQQPPAYDEAKELADFIAEFKLDGKIYRDENTFQWLPSSDHFDGFKVAARVTDMWTAWSARAQSRAQRGEV